MSPKEQNNELETLVRDLFKQSRKKSDISTKNRLTLILKRGLHEIALRDLLVLSSHIIFAMMTMLTLFAKPFQNKP